MKHIVLTQKEAAKTLSQVLLKSLFKSVYPEELSKLMADWILSEKFKLGDDYVGIAHSSKHADIDRITGIPLPHSLPINVTADSEQLTNKCMLYVTRTIEEERRTVINSEYCVIVFNDFQEMVDFTNQFKTADELIEAMLINNCVDRTIEATVAKIERVKLLQTAEENRQDSIETLIDKYCTVIEALKHELDTLRRYKLTRAYYGCIGQF